MFRQPTEILQFVLVCFSIGSTIIAILSWYSASIQKRYAAQRDFQHLKKNYEQLTANQGEILKELEQRFDDVERDLLDIKNIINTLIVKISPDTSSGWYRQQRDKQP